MLRTNTQIMIQPIIIVLFAHLIFSGTAESSEIPLVEINDDKQCIVTRIAREYAKNKFADDSDDFELNDDEILAAWDCVSDNQHVAFANIGVSGFLNWQRYSRTPYLSAHGSLVVSGKVERIVYVMNLANSLGKNYGLYSKRSSALPKGAILAKPSIVIEPYGQVKVGGLALMTKLKPSSSINTGDWRYQMVWPSSIVSDIRPANKIFNEGDCVACHISYTDRPKHTLLPPPEYWLDRSNL